jgi:hypothetical protein
MRNLSAVYVDKTEHIYNMINSGTVYFLSRPRRFGKSLLIDTMEELFKGNKELFKGLFIYDKWNWEIKYPVLKLDFGARRYDTTEVLQKSLTYFVNSRAEQFNITLEAPTLSDRFEELFIKLHEKTGQRVVVLIDEYDKAITDYLSDPQKAESNRLELHNFYQVLKAADKHIQFIFLTGISKFSGMSVFSALNNPDDITRSRDFAAICGYTQEELETNFADYIDTTAKELNKSKDELLDDIRYWYNGYTWDGKTRVYNPFSTLSFFKHREFANYWIKTGTSISAKILLKDYDLLKNLFNQITVDGDFFDGFDLDSINGTSFLFQSGYLTIKDVDNTENGIEYNLEIPNKEVRVSLTRYMLSAYSDIAVGDLSPMAKDIHNQIKNNDAQGLEKTLRRLFAVIPFKLYMKEEKYYHSIFLLIMNFLGFQVQGEVATNIGAIDAVWKQNNLTAVIEIKYSHEKSSEKLLDEAMNQIKDKKYYEAYLDKPVVLLAIAFSAGKNKKRLTEIGCKFEKIQ